MIAPNGQRRVLTVVRWPVGGIRTYLLYNYPHLMEAGYQFTLVGPADDSFRRLRDELRDWDGVEFVEAPKHRRQCLLRATVRRLLKVARFDLIHSQGFIAASQTSMANLGVGLPHVVTSHDVIRPVQFGGALGQVKLHVMGYLLSRADAIVSVSDDAQANLVEHLPYLAHSRCRLLSIFNGIELDRFPLDDSKPVRSLREQIGIGPDVFLIGFLGRLMEQKGFLPFISALGSLSENETSVPYHVVTVGDGDYVREYRAEVERRGLSGKVSFHGLVADAAPVLRQLDLLVMPSLWEACPILPMEAMVLGVPILGSDCVGLREVLRGTPSRVVPAGDVGALGQALREAIERPWKSEAQAYIPEARRRFDSGRSAEELRRVFERYALDPCCKAGQVHQAPNSRVVANR